MSELRRVIQQLIKDNTTVTMRLGTVKSLDKTKDTCNVDPLDGGAIFYKVKLRSLIKDPTATSSRIVIYPKLESLVVIGIINNDSNNAFVVEVSEIDSALVEMNEFSFKAELKTDGTLAIDSTKIAFNNGQLGGLVKAQTTAQKLNLLENDLNTLKSIFAAWVPVSEGTLKTALTAWYTSIISNTQQSQLENPVIKH